MIYFSLVFFICAVRAETTFVCLLWFAYIVVISITAIEKSIAYTRRSVYIQLVSQLKRSGGTTKGKRCDTVLHVCLCSAYIQSMWTLKNIPLLLLLFLVRYDLAHVWLHSISCQTPMVLCECTAERCVCVCVCWMVWWPLHYLYVVIIQMV